MAREFAIACVMDLEWRLVDGNVGVREAVVDLELDLLNQEGKILLLDRVVRVTVFPQSAHIATPLMRERKVLPGRCCIPHFLRHRPNNYRHVHFRTLDAIDFGHLFKWLVVGHRLVNLVSRCLNSIRLVVRPIGVVLHY